MKAVIEIKNKVIYVTFDKKQKGHVYTRMLELGFLSKDGRVFTRKQPLRTNEYDYLIGMLGSDSLGMIYIPTAEKGFLLDTVVPDSMGYEMHIAMRKVKQKINQTFFDYVAEKLQFTNDELSNALACEQIDGVALAIYNMEVRKQGIIISDQTGIGKGRQAASLIRYGIVNGHQPIFLSEKDNLFTDLYRDLVDIHSGHFVPFIVNGKSSSSNIKDKEGNVVYKAPVLSVQEVILESGELPSDYDFICATYKQFSQPMKKPLKPNFLYNMAKGNILILDEAHNASGLSNTGKVMREAVRSAQGVCFLSATYAKRADNMPLYAETTAMKEANMTNEELVTAILYGGVALQEVLAAQLVSEGQMIRRERTSEGIEVNYIELSHREKEHTVIADKITEVMRDIASFQLKFIKPIIKDLDKDAKDEGAEVGERRGTSELGVQNTPYFSKIFNIVNQMLFSINSADVALQAIKHLKAGRKPIIAFANTMGSFLEDMGGVDDVINADFTTVLLKGLESVMSYTYKGMGGKGTKMYVLPNQLADGGFAEYRRIENLIDSVSSGIFISPLDVIIEKITEAGYSVGEVTGRKLAVRYAGNESGKAVIISRKKENTSDLFRRFNENKIDCLLINQSGATGASAHAKPNDVVSAKDVKQRVMIVLQPELDINTEIQKRGRINRTGQIMKPIYDYIISPIPSQKRLMMMLKMKLKSLDANTTSNQKANDSQLQGVDFLNKYGDYVVTEYLIEMPTLNTKLDDPLGVMGYNATASGKIPVEDNAALRVSGRVAVLSTKDQKQFYNDVEGRYENYVQYIKDSGDYDLEVEALNLKAETVSSEVLIVGKGGKSDFGKDTMLEKCECNILKKPMPQDQVESEIKKALDGHTAVSISEDIVSRHKAFNDKKKSNSLFIISENYAYRIESIKNRAAYIKLESEEEKSRFFKRMKLDLEDEMSERLLSAESTYNEKFNYVDKYLRFFQIGNGYYYPSLGDPTVSIPAICLGIKIDKSKPNPFAPSAIKIRFAVSDSRRVVELNASGEMGALLNRVMAQSMRLSAYDGQEMLSQWSKSIEKYSKNRGVRYIITGNILQAAAGYIAKLVSYTTKKGAVKKGILLPESWSPSSDGNSAATHVSVPIVKVAKYILGIGRSTIVSSEDKITIGKVGESFLITMPKKKSHIPIYTDPEILKLVANKQGFELVAGDMRAIVIESKMLKMLRLLGNNHSVSIKLSRNMFEEHVGKTKVVDDSKEDAKAKVQFEKDAAEFETKMKQQRATKKPPVREKSKKEKMAEAIAVAMKMNLSLLKLQLGSHPNIKVF